jgi:tripartite-type tricarboxylate transporter receptor subunit TctC
MLSAAVAAGAVRSAQAQNYPSRVVKIIVPWPAGGFVDVEVRRLAVHLARTLGQPVIIDNRAGASGTIGTAVGAQALPDGYTLTWGSTTPLSTAPVLVPTLPYDPIKDFEPVIQYVRNPAVLVINPSLGVRDLQGLVARARKRPGQLNYASIGPASSLHIMGELLKVTLGIDVVHVPYKGVAPALLSILANETQLGFVFPVNSAPHIRSGKLTALFVTGPERVSSLPDVPTATEVGYPDLEVIFFGGLLAPAGTSTEIVLRLNSEMNKITRIPEIVESMHSTGAATPGGSPDDFRKVISKELVKWRRIVKVTGVKME